MTLKTTARKSGPAPISVRAKKPSPAPISRLVIGYRCAKLLFVAAKRDLFTRLSREPASADEISRDFGFDRRATRIFLDSLAAMGFLLKAGLVYRNSDVSDSYLVRGKKGFLGDNLKYQDFIWDSWSDLEDALRQGVPSHPLDARLKDEQEFLGRYIRGMSDIAELPAREIAEALGPLGDAAILDVGGGVGKYALTLASLNPKAKAVLLDLPGTLKIAREFVDASPCGDRVELREGNYHQADLGRDKYGLILISHVTHHEGASSNLSLIKRCHAALRRGGRLVIHDFTTGDDRTSPPFSAVFSAHMLVTSREGATYSSSDYEGWLREAGFGKLWRKAVCAGSDTPTEIIVGSKE